MSRREGFEPVRAALLGLAIVGLTAMGCSPETAGDEPAGRPNLLLITVDTLRADQLACYGGAAGVGTELCALANGGTRFEWAFATAPSTAPSVASLLTSRYPTRHRVNQRSTSYLEDAEVTLPEQLQTAGYLTAAFVSNPVLERGRNFDQGFDVYDQRMTRREANRPGFVEREAEATTTAVLAWARVASREPWFLWVHYQDPHGPYLPPDAPAVSDEPAAERLPVLADNSGIGGIPAYQELPGLRSPGSYARRYAAEIRYLGPHIEHLVKELDSLGSPPAIVATADHGEALGEDGVFFSHGHSLAAELIHVPLLFRPPEAGARTVRAVGVVTTPVSVVDVAPTLLVLAGLSVPESFQGVVLPVVDHRIDAGRSRRASLHNRAVFAEEPDSAVIIADGLYYSRPGSPFGETGGASIRRLGNPVLPLPARSLALPWDPGQLNYRLAPFDSEGPPDDRIGAVAQRLEAHLALADPRPPTVREISPALREQLRALGYVDDDPAADQPSAPSP